jgi:hypothetical protein
MRNPPLDRDRLLSASAVCLCVLAVAASATALESSLSTAAPAPPGDSPGSGLSLLGLLFALLDALLSVFGLSLERGGAASGPQLLRAATAALVTLYRHRLALVAGVGAVTTLGLALRTRGRIRRWMDGSARPSATEQSGTDPADRSRTKSTADWPEGTPSNEVGLAWVEMGRTVDVSDPHALTPGEWQTAAVEAGLDPEPVRTITETFREVRYGPGSLSPSQLNDVRRARAALSLDGGDAE